MQYGQLVLSQAVTCVKEQTLKYPTANKEVDI